MRITNDTLTISKARAYGAVDLGLEDYEDVQGCPYRYFRMVEGTLPEVGKYELQYGTLIHRALFLAEEEDLLLLDEALPKAWSETGMGLGMDAYKEAESDLTAFLERGGLNMSTVAVEVELRFPLLEKDGKTIYFGGRLDWVGLNPEDMGVIAFADYKTTRYPTSQADLDKDIQFAGYAALLAENLDKVFPAHLEIDEEFRIMGILEQLKWGQLYTEKTLEDIELFKAWAKAVALAILEDDDPRPKLNRWCGSCSIRWDCELWKSLPGEGESLAERLSATTSLEDRVRIMKRAQSVLRQLKSLVDEVHEELLENPGIYDGTEYYIRPNKKTTYDIPVLREIMEDDFWGAVSVLKGKVEEWSKATGRDVRVAMREYYDGVKLGKRAAK